MQYPKNVQNSTKNGIEELSFPKYVDFVAHKFEENQI